MRSWLNHKILNKLRRRTDTPNTASQTPEGVNAVEPVLPEPDNSSRRSAEFLEFAQSAGGFGVTPDVLAEIAALPIDVFTTGNHVWDKKEGVAILDRERRLLRPHNYPQWNPGTGLHVGETAAGVPVTCTRYAGMIHPFFSLSGAIPQALDAIQQIADAVSAADTHNLLVARKGKSMLSGNS